MVTDMLIKIKIQEVINIYLLVTKYKNYVPLMKHKQCYINIAR